MLRFETERLTLRPWEEDDLPSLNAILSDAQVMEFSEKGPLTRAQQEAWLTENHTPSGPGGLPFVLAMEAPLAGTCIGYISLSNDPERVAPGKAEIGFRLAREHWGKGYAPEAAAAVITAAKDVPGISACIAIVDPRNTRSLGVIRKIGMTYARDVMFYGYDYPDHAFKIDVAQYPLTFPPS
ncbi:MAG: GNAT family N-acetyltransferase [Pseudomonadota bacterium]